MATILHFTLKVSTVLDVCLATCRHLVVYSFMCLQMLKGSPQELREVV